jgi:hypothetical protein
LTNRSGESLPGVVERMSGQLAVELGKTNEEMRVFVQTDRTSAAKWNKLKLTDRSSSNSKAVNSYAK